MKITFQVVTRNAYRVGKCPVCGGRVERSKRFKATLNPWNTHPDGSRKSAADIHADLNAEALAWKPDFRHGRCKP